MQGMSERPEAPPSFEAIESERDSEVHVKAARRTPESEAPEMPHSETRIATRPNTGAAITDEAWAAQAIGEPVVALSADELRRLPLDHRAGYLLSLMDGTMDLETVLDVSAMPRAEALSAVRDLFEAGVVTFR